MKKIALLHCNHARRSEGVAEVSEVMNFSKDISVLVKSVSPGQPSLSFCLFQIILRNYTGSKMFIDLCHIPALQ